MCVFCVADVCDNARYGRPDRWSLRNSRNQSRLRWRRQQRLKMEKRFRRTVQSDQSPISVERLVGSIRLCSWQQLDGNIATGTIPANGYYLVQEAVGAGGTDSLPTPDATGTTPMGATGFKLALVKDSTGALSGACPTSTTSVVIVDFVGVGAANCYEGTTPTAAPSNSTAALRNGGGCTDTNNSGSDFTVPASAPTPRNSASPTNVCSGGPVSTPLSGIGTANPSSLIHDITTTALSVTVTPGTIPDSTGITVTGNLTSIGGSAAQAFSYDAVHGVYTFSTTVPSSAGTGTKTLPITIRDDQLRNASATITLTVAAPAPQYAIHDVQGSGDASLLVGQNVMVDRAKLAGRFPPRVRAKELWRVAPECLEQAQDDATLLAIRDQERAGLDIITDGEMRRESYSNRFATALEGVDIDNPGTALDRSGHPNPVPRVTGKVRRKHPVEVRDVKFLRANTDRMIKMTVPGPFTMSQQAQNDFYKDEEEMALDYAAAVNAEIKDLFAAGADIVQIDEPYMQARPEKARKYRPRRRSTPRSTA